MRLFTAIALPDYLRGDLASLQPRHPDIRLTPEPQLHLTLRYIGETDKARTRRTIQALSQITFQPFDITIKGTGSFPGPDRPSVLWAGVAYHPYLGELYDSIHEELHRVGVPQEIRTFHPHVTLGRIRKSRKEPASIKEAPPLNEVLDEFLNGSTSRYQTTFHVDRFRLYQSRLHSGGAIHYCLQEYHSS
ncbi:RNA 2',3'-cyclic phosphodiesterase [Balneolales bacterium ANBcel1]|nr:RNA 2',3'-cyclic phosphodiesterase [Balneolales bacterium ANBcel1]